MMRKSIINLAKEKFFAIITFFFQHGGIESRYERTDDDTRAYRFGYIIERDGLEIARYDEGKTPSSFELAISMDQDFSLPDRHPSDYVISRRLIELRWEHRNYVVASTRVEYRVEDDRTYLVICDPEEYDPVKDRIMFTVGREAPVIVRGIL